MEENREPILIDAPEAETPSFDEWLRSDPKLLAEFERRKQAALDAERQRLEAEKEQAVKIAAAKAEELAKMSGEERLEQLNRQREEALDKREEALKKRELRALAAGLIAEKGLPVTLLDAVDDRGESECRASIEALERAYRAAVQEGVEQRLKGDAPMRGDKRSPDLDSMTDADYYRAVKARG